MNLDNVVKFLSAGRPNVGLYQDAEVVRRNAREVIGFSRNQLGEFESAGRRTATEASLVEDASNRRMGRKGNGVAKVFKNLFEKINPIIFAFWKTPRVVEIVGEAGSREFAKFTGPELKGDYSYEITFSNEAPEGIEARKQTAIQLYATLVADPLVDPVMLRKFLIRAFNDPEFSSIFVDEQQANQVLAQRAMMEQASATGGERGSNVSGAA